MYCKNCGKEIDDKAVMCPHCGTVLDESFMKRNAPSASNSGLVTAARVFIILSFIAYALAFFVLLGATIGSSVFLGNESYEDTSVFITVLTYFIIITIVGIIGIVFGAKALKKINAGVKPSTAVSVCVLLFTNAIAGILLLCTKETDYSKV
ncbi:MAG: zinc ribbon domain-containing protein [Clostridia bacterium]|nr:zinc ribbon domain-containing protein [Clostridia bacterium]